MRVENLDSRITNIAKLSAAIHIWDSLFPMKYFEYRQHLKKIASNHYYPVTNDPLDIADDDWLIVSDDDDWTSPNIFFDTDADLVHWRSAIYNSCAKFQIDVTGSEGMSPESNSYAVRGRFLKGLQSNLANDLLQQHQKSLKIARQQKAKIAFRTDVLSAYNLHPGCAHILKSAKSKHAICSKFVDPSTKPLIQFDWLETFVSEFIQIYKSLYGHCQQLMDWERTKHFGESLHQISSGERPSIQPLVL